MTLIVFNSLVLLFDVFTAVTIFYILSTKHSNHFPRSHKFFLWIGGAGLIGQAVRNLQFLIFGTSVTDNQLPLWVLKDVGYWGIAFLVILKIIKNTHKEKK